jgi:tetratricopeptide (TPR) repeat protein
MAVARLVCGDCGGELSRSDAFCPKCGEPIERDVVLAAQDTTVAKSVARRCDVCGHENVNAGAYCESCGARLFVSSPLDRSAAQAAGRERVKEKRPEKQQQRKKPRKNFGGRRVEPWQISAGIGTLALVAFFVYSEVTRETPKTQARVHENVPAEMGATLQEIERLQKTVDTTPNDAASMLRLANLLHDNAMQDARLLFRAEDVYKRYLAIKPNDPDARVDLGIIYFELARVDSMNADALYTKAIGEMQTVAKANPRHQPAAFNLGIVNLHTGNVEESTRWFQKAVEINPSSDLGTRAKRLLEQHSSFQPPSN